MQALIAAHVAEAAPSLSAKRPEVPEPLAALVMRCLDKNPASRPASAAELLTALESVNTSGEKAVPAPLTPEPGRKAWLEPHDSLRGCGGAVLALIAAGVMLRGRLRAPVEAATTDKSLAVLPFVATGGDTANSYLGEGIADEVSNTLAQVPGLRIAGRSSAARMARTGASVQEAAKGLGVHAVLDGTVRRAGDRIRVDAELANGADGVVLWRDSYDRPARDIFAVQDEIARAIAGQLQVALSGRRNRGRRNSRCHGVRSLSEGDVSVPSPRCGTGGSGSRSRAGHRTRQQLRTRVGGAELDAHGRAQLH